MKKFAFGLQILVSAVLLLLVFRSVDWQEALPLLASVSLLPLVAATCTQFSIVLVDALRLFVHVRARASVWPHAKDIRFGYVLKISIAGTSAALFTPGAVGNEAYKLVRLRNFTEGVANALFLVAVLRIVSLVVIAALFAWSSYQVGRSIQVMDISSNVLWLISLLIVLAIAAVLLVVRRYPSLFSRISTELRRSLVSIRSIRPAELLLMLAFTVAIEVLRVVSLMFFIHAAGGSVELVTLVLASTIGVVVTLLPISINGLGVREASMMGVFVAAGMTASAAVFVVVVSRITTLLWNALGVYYLVFDKETRIQAR